MLRSRRRGRRSQPAGRASLGVVKADADFGQEYPDGDAASTEAHATLCRAGQALTSDLERRVARTFGMPPAASMALAVLDGADRPLTPSEVSERLLVASASMTALLDFPEHRGWIRRTPNPDDRRSVLVQITAEGQATADQMLPGIRELERRTMDVLTGEEKAQLLDLLSRILKRSAGDPEPLADRRLSRRFGKPPAFTGQITGDRWPLTGTNVATEAAPAPPRSPVYACLNQNAATLRSTPIGGINPSCCARADLDIRSRGASWRE